MRRWMAAALIVVALMVAGAPAVAKQAVTVELFYSGGWHDHSTDLFRRDSITINHAILDRQTGLAPSDASMTWRGKDGKMNPDNPRSPLFGLIDDTTPVRITVSATDIRFTGRIFSWKPKLNAGKGEGWVESQAQGTIRRLGQGEPPVESALNQTITRGIGVAPTELWPLEAGRLAFTSVTSGAVASSFFDPQILSQEPTFKGIPGSKPSVVLPAEGSTIVNFPVTPYADTGFWAAQTNWVYTRDMPPGGLASFHAYLSNGRQVHLFLFDSTGEPLSFQVAVTDDTTVYYTNTTVLSGASVLDQPLSLMMSLNSAAGGTVTGKLLDGAGTVRASATTTGVGYGTVSRMEISNIQPGVSDPGGNLGVSHLAFYANPAFDISVDSVTIARAASGFTGEKAGDRFNRVCALNNIAATIVGSASDTQPMGPQLPDTVLGTLGEVARTDAGIIHDTRTQEGLTFRTGRSLYNQ